MEFIKDEFELLPVLWKLEYFSEYLKDVEELIDSKAKELDNRSKVMAQELEQGEGFPWEYVTPDGLAYHFLEEGYEKIGNVFPNLLRRSLFMYIYSVLEEGLNNSCRLLNFQQRPLEDVKGKGEGIKRARKYLEDAGVNFPDKKEWNEIFNYQRLRNCITHNMGRLNGCKKKEMTRKFVLDNPYLSLTYTDDDGEDVYGMSEFVEVMFHEGFCEEVIQTIGSFVEQLRINMEHRRRNEDF